MRELENNMVREPLNQPQLSNPQKNVLLMIIPNSTLKFSAPSAPEPSRCRCYHIFPTKYVQREENSFTTISALISRANGVKGEHDPLLARRHT